MCVKITHNQNRARQLEQKAVEVSITDRVVRRNVNGTHSYWPLTRNCRGHCLKRSVEFYLAVGDIFLNENRYTPLRVCIICILSFEEVGVLTERHGTVSRDFGFL